MTKKNKPNMSEKAWLEKQAQRSRAKLLNVVAANEWTAFASITAEDEAQRQSYDQMCVLADKVRRYLKNQEIYFLYVIEKYPDGKTGYHIHGLLAGDVEKLYESSGKYTSGKAKHVKTDGLCFILPELEKYGVGEQLFQMLEDSDSAYHAACYMAQNFTQLRKDLNEQQAENKKRQLPLYHAPRGLERSQSCLIGIGKYKGRVFKNGNLSAALVMPLKAFNALCDMSTSHNLEAYHLKGETYTEKGQTMEMLRLVGNVKDIRRLLALFAAMVDTETAVSIFFTVYTVAKQKESYQQRYSSALFSAASTFFTSLGETKDFLEAIREETHLEMTDGQFEEVKTAYNPISVVKEYDHPYVHGTIYQITLPSSIFGSEVF